MNFCGNLKKILVKWRVKLKQTNNYSGYKIGSKDELDMMVPILDTFIRNSFMSRCPGKNTQDKTATHYLSLFANNDKTTFSQKNLNFAKMCLQTIHHRQQFLRATCKFTKNAFVFHSNTVPSSEDSAEHRTKNLFAKCQRLIIHVS